MEKAKRELLCQSCGRDYTVWFTANEKWNKACGEGVHYLCLDCFALLYEEKTGEKPIWKLDVNF